MYSSAQQQELLDLTRELLDGGGPSDAGELASALRSVINFHDWSYYVQSEALISDYEYDQLFSQLKQLEAEDPKLVSPDSPTQRVARGLTEEFETVEHLAPMLSLDNSYDENDLIEFDQRLRKLLPGEKLVYSVEPKFDGASIALVYENDLLVRAATRGNGLMGDDITNNAKVLRSIPLSAGFSKYGISRIEIRGEAIIRLSVFERMNREREKQDLELFKNARNTASGGLRMKDPSEVARRGLEGILYQVGYAADDRGANLLGTKLASHAECLRMLTALGFQTASHEVGIFDNVNDIVAFYQQRQDERDSYPYEIDGIVVKLDDLRLQQRAGATAHHPRWAIAYKFKARQATTKLINVIFNVGRTGAVTPVAKLQPVNLSGVTISSVSLHNEDLIREKDLHLNDTVLIERAGDVIPYVIGPVKDARTGAEKPIRFPKNCPSCHTELVKPEGEAHWRCINAACPAQMEERLIHFASKGAMDINRLGRDIIGRFIEEGFLGNLADIYKLDFQKIASLERWSEVSATNLKNGIEASKRQPLWRLIVGLGIRHVGTTMAKMLAKQVDDILLLADWSIEQLADLEDVGPKVAQSIHDFFHNPENIRLIEELRSLGVNTRRTEADRPTGGVLFGKTFLFTGSLTRFTRERAKEMVEQNGGRILSSVSPKLNYLVVGGSPGSKLKKAQEIGTIEVIDEEGFLGMIS